MRKKLKRQFEQRHKFMFDINRVPFSRRLSYLSVDERLAPTESGADRKQLALIRQVRTYGTDPEAKRDRMLAFRPIFNQESIPYRVDADPGRMRVQTSYGSFEVCFDSADVIRIRGQGLTVRFFTKMTTAEGAVDRLDGTYQINYFMHGEYLFVPIKGKIDFEAEWIWESRKSSDVLLDIEPDESGYFELAIHHAEHGAERYESYRPFEECAKESLDDYENWYSMYPPVPSKYEYIKRLSVYAIWICQIGPRGLITEPAILFNKPTESSCFSWHQVYHAMIMHNDVDMAVQTLMNLFAYQDEFGEIADLYDDKFNNIMATKPPFHGYGLLYMLERIGDSITVEHCKHMYKGLSKWYEWWMTLRDTDNDGVPQYNHGCESGNDFTDLMAKGVPTEAPDLISYLALLAEGLGKLASRMGMESEAAKWQGESERLINVLVNEFWNGKKFIARLSTTHEIIESDELEVYTPMMLGARLPEHIVKAMAKDLANPELYYTPYGLRSRPKQYDNGQALPGMIAGFAQVKILPGLYYAGEKELARKMIAGFCDLGAERMPSFMFREPVPPAPPPSPNAGFPDGRGGPPASRGQGPGTAPADAPSEPPSRGGLMGLSALAAAMWLDLATFLEEIS